MISIQGINQNNRRKWTYPDLESARRPIPHSDEVPVPAFDHPPELTKSSDEINSHVDASISYSNESQLEGAVATPLRFNQAELYDLIRDLNLSKETSEVIASWLNEKHLQLRTNITFYCTREKVLLPYFSREKNLVFSDDVGGLLQTMRLKEYNP